jgi:hypothetical protein
MARIGWDQVPHVEDLTLQRFLSDLLEIVKAIEIRGDGVKIRSGQGSPEGVIAANPGSLFLRTDGGISTTLYVKTSGTSTTGWTGK